MKTQVVALIAGVCLTAMMCGCVYHTVEGRTRMGVPLAADRITSRYERPVDQVFNAAKEVLAFCGTLTSENTVAKTLEARIDKNTVTVKVQEVEPNISQVTVQGRKSNGFGNIQLASEIDKRIALQMQSR